MTREDVEAAYAAALERATALGLSVVADGYGGDGTHYWFVPSASDPGADWHRVWVDGGRLHCTCAGGQHGQVCQHKALARQRYTQEEQVLKHAEARQHEPRESRPSRVFQYDGRRRNGSCGTCGVPFELGEDLVLFGDKAYHVDCVPGQTSGHPGDDALRRNDKPFTMMK